MEERERRVDALEREVVEARTQLGSVGEDVRVKNFVIEGQVEEVGHLKRALVDGDTQHARLQLRLRKFETRVVNQAKRIGDAKK